VKTITHEPPLYDKTIFIGEIEDIQDKKFGFLLPNRRKLAEKYFDFVGYTLTFNPKDYMDKMKIRKKLGYGKAPLAVCSIGGTSAGKALLDLSLKAVPLIQKEIPDFEMVLVLGPEVPLDSVKPVRGVKIAGYLPELYKHLAASDLAIVTGGGTITLELTALQKPFLYFPLENHFEQEVAVANRCERHNAGVKMNFSKTTPEILARKVVENIGREVKYATIPIDGAQKAANLISEFR
jgi:UDP-N-acetylglucosamine:LPS N-acetylglucosamine transferase